MVILAMGGLWELVMGHLPGEQQQPRAVPARCLWLVPKTITSDNSFLSGVALVTVSSQAFRTVLAYEAAGPVMFC